MSAGADAYAGDSSMSGMKSTADALSGGKTNFSNSSGNSDSSDGNWSPGKPTVTDVINFKWYDRPGKTDLVFLDENNGYLLMHDLDGQGSTMKTILIISSIDLDAGTMTYKVKTMEFRSPIHKDEDKAGDGKFYTAPLRIDGRTLYWDNRTFTR